jgi:hypothetical protein
MTVAIASPTPLDRTRPVLRIRPAPALEPPYDDERPPEAWPACRGQLEMVRPPTRPELRRQTAIAEPSPAGKPGAAGGAGTGAGHAVDARAGVTAARLPPAPGNPSGREPHSAALRPTNETSIAAHRFVGACLEVLNGFRPPVHLRRLCSPGVYPDVIDQLTRRAVRIRITPPRPTLPGRPSTVGVLKRRLRVCEPRAGVAEAAAVLTNGEATWAMAVRLERYRDGWLCTLMQVI